MPRFCTLPLPHIPSSRDRLSSATIPIVAQGGDIAVSRSVPFDNQHYSVPSTAPGGSLLTPKEAARFLRVSRTTLYRLVETRRLRFYRIGRQLRFDSPDLAAYLQAHRMDIID